MSNFDENHNSNDVNQNMNSVPYTSVPFTHLGNYESDQVGNQIGLQSNAWGSNVTIKADNSIMTSGSNVEDEYSVDGVKLDMSSANLGSRYLNDRERIQLHNQMSWEEASKQDVLVVRCRDTTAELYKLRLGSGSKGKCIKLGDTWLSPTEFETLAGRGSSKDWKRSIRFGGHTLQKLIEQGILAPHAISCTCSICCGDSTLTGPVRLFTPYKRKRRENDLSRGNPNVDRSRNINMGFINEYDNSQMSSINLIGANPVSFDHIDEIVTFMMNAVQQLRLSWDQMKIHNDTLRDAAVNQARVQAEMEKREALNQQRSDVISILKRILPVDQESLIQQIVAQLQLESLPSAKACSNCGRDAYLECTACRRSCYCSTFCQQKDWPQHQHNCGIHQSGVSPIPAESEHRISENSVVDTQNNAE